MRVRMKKPVRVYSGMPIGQLIYFETKGTLLTPYHAKGNAKYTARSPQPVESMMWKNNF